VRSERALEIKGLSGGGTFNAIRVCGEGEVFPLPGCSISGKAMWGKKLWDPDCHGDERGVAILLKTHALWGDNTLDVCSSGGGASSFVVFGSTRRSI